MLKRPQVDVCAPGANFLGDDACPHEEGEGLAPEAVCEHRFERGRHNDRPDEDLRARPEAQAGENRCRAGEGRADQLGKPFRRPRNELGRDLKSRCDHPRDELAERA